MNTPNLADLYIQARNLHGWTSTTHSGAHNQPRGNKHVGPQSVGVSTYWQFSPHCNLHQRNKVYKNSVIADMAAQYCTVRIFAVSVTFENITINHILPSLVCFGLHSCLKEYMGIASISFTHMALKRNEFGRRNNAK